MKTLSDKEIVGWLCDHATWIIAILEHGEEIAIKVPGNDGNARELLVNKLLSLC